MRIPAIPSLAVLLPLLPLVSGLAGCRTAGPPASTEAIVTTSADSARLCLLNANGWTLIPLPQIVFDNGRKLVVLSRGRYFVTQLPPGRHELSLDLATEPALRLEVVAGETYYVRFLLRRATATAFHDPPLILISKQDAAALLRQMKRQPR